MRTRLIILEFMLVKRQELADASALRVAIDQRLAQARAEEGT
jgi:hypothetical protein